jgi:cullin 3
MFLLQVAGTADEVLLDRLSKAWGEHQSTMVMVRDILMYMDRTYVPPLRKVPIYDQGLLLFRDVIARHENVQGRLRNLLLLAVSSERAGQLVERLVVKNSLSMLADLGVDSLSVYDHDFEAPFLAATAAFYRAESLEFLSQNTSGDYVAKAEVRLAEEHARVRHYLHASTEPKLRRVVEMELITTHARSLVEMEGSGVVAMVEAGRTADLGRLYDLLARVPPTLELLRACVCDHVKRVGLALVSDQEKVKSPVDFVRKLLGMRDQYDLIVDVAFKGEKASQKRLKEAFEEFINADTRCASYLVMYIDELLKSALKGLPEADADAQLEKVIVLFRYLQDKDVFESFYKSYLAKRLLGGRSLSEDSERSMIAKLKTECGYQFTSKLEGMFTDMAMSKGTMEQFSEAQASAREMAAEMSADATTAAPGGGAATLSAGSLSSPGGGGGSFGGVELEVKVLTAAHWPSSMLPPCHLPPEVLPAHGAFCDFYLSKHTGRKLAWQTSLGSAILKARFGAQSRHELDVSTFQMCILMRFNGDGNATQSLEALEDLGIPPTELRRHLVSLCTPKHRILTKESKGKAIEDRDSFTFNASYSAWLKKPTPLCVEYE